jgi:hypothetical protein
MQHLKGLRIILNAKTVVIAAAAVTSTYFCRRYGLTADFPLTLVTIAVVFPVVFSIGGAYKRRENALAKYSSIKSHGRALYFAARDWLSDSDDALLEQIKELLRNLLGASRRLFMNPMAQMGENEKAVYHAFSELSTFIKTMRQHGLASGEASRCNQFLSKMMIAFEDVKHIYQYRTPRSLRAFSHVFIIALPVLYGPYFAELSKEYSSGLEYVMPILLSVILVSLDNIQEHMENPFDQVGEDDVVINVEKFIARLDE